MRAAYAVPLCLYDGFGTPIAPARVANGRTSCWSTEFTSSMTVRSPAKVALSVGMDRWLALNTAQARSKTFREASAKSARRLGGVRRGMGAQHD